MHVHVDRLGRHLQEQRHQRMAVPCEKVLIGAAQGAEQQAVAHRPSVHEEVLGLGVAPVQGGQANVAGEPQALAFRIDGQRVGGELAAHDGAKPGQAGLKEIAVSSR